LYNKHGNPPRIKEKHIKANLLKLYNLKADIMGFYPRPLREGVNDWAFRSSSSPLAGEDVDAKIYFYYIIFASEIYLEVKI